MVSREGFQAFSDVVEQRFKEDPTRFSKIATGDLLSLSKILPVPGYKLYETFRGKIAPNITKFEFSLPTYQLWALIQFVDVNKLPTRAEVEQMKQQEAQAEAAHAANETEEPPTDGFV